MSTWSVLKCYLCWCSPEIQRASERTGLQRNMLDSQIDIRGHMTTWSGHGHTQQHGWLREWSQQLSIQTFIPQFTHCLHLFDIQFTKWDLYHNMHYVVLLTDFSRACDKKFPAIQPATASSCPVIIRPLEKLYGDFFKDAFTLLNICSLMVWLLRLQKTFLAYCTVHISITGKQSLHSHDNRSIMLCLWPTLYMM